MDVFVFQLSLGPTFSTAIFLFSEPRFVFEDVLDLISPRLGTAEAEY